MNRLSHLDLSITLEGQTYGASDFRQNLEFGQDSYKRQLYLFLQDWYSDSPTLMVRTSGSTGIPKEMGVSKQRMLESARQTCSFLGLKKDDTALLCMPLEYIAGKMMVVRALFSGLNLYVVEPTGHPLKDMGIHFDFSAMIPLQVYNSLNDAIERERFSKIDSVIIGGGAIDAKLEEQLSVLPNNVYSSYGMTETLSHIALRKLNGKDASEYYKPFPSVTLSLSDENALIIDAPSISESVLYTNDIAVLNPDQSFKIIGRKDNIINSGGVKIQIEVVEELLRPYIEGQFAISSLPDPKFGETVVLILEHYKDDIPLEKLPAYYRPKNILVLDKIPLTGTGKISRKELKEILRNR